MGLSIKEHVVMASSLQDVLEIWEFLECLGTAGSVVRVCETCKTVRDLVQRCRPCVAVRTRDSFVFSSGAQVRRLLAQLSAAYQVTALGLRGSLRSAADKSAEAAVLDIVRDNHLLGWVLNKKKLLRLDLSDNGLEDAAGSALAAALRVNSSLQSLNLSENSLEDAAGSALAAALRVNSSLQSLDLSGTRLSRRSIYQLGEALRDNSALRSLDLGANRELGNTRAVARVLSMNSSLRSLKLRCINMRGKGAIAIAGALRTNNSLQELDLSHNAFDRGEWGRLGGQVGARLSEALLVNSSLRSLQLCWNALCLQDMLQLAGALRVNRTLTSLSLSGNTMGHESCEGARAFAEVLVANDSLRTLDLSYCGIEAVGGASLVNALCKNSSLRELDLSRNTGLTGLAIFSDALEVHSTRCLTCRVITQ